MDASTIEQMSQGLFMQVDDLSAAQRQQLAGTLQCGSLRQQVIGIIESVAAPTLSCPRCGSHHLEKHGFAHGLQRFRCNVCGRTFNSLTGTPLARLRYKGKWLPYLAHMLDSATVRIAADRAEIHRNTSFRWRHRFLTWSKRDRKLPLHGIVEVGETHLIESQKGARHLARPGRRRGSAGVLRDASTKQVRIMVARDGNGRTMDTVAGLTQSDRAHQMKLLKRALAPGCILIPDGYAVNAKCPVAYRLRPSTRNDARMRERGRCNVPNVDAYLNRFKHWLRRFHGVASRYLANYLGWFWAIDGERISTTEQFLRAALAAPLHT